MRAASPPRSSTRPSLRTLTLLAATAPWGLPSSCAARRDAATCRNVAFVRAGGGAERSLVVDGASEPPARACSAPSGAREGGGGEPTSRSWNEWGSGDSLRTQPAVAKYGIEKSPARRRPAEASRQRPPTYAHYEQMNAQFA